MGGAYAEDEEEDVAVVAAEQLAPPFAERLRGALAGVRRDREGYLGQLRRRLAELSASAATRGLDIRVFASAVQERLRRVSQDGDEVCRRCALAAGSDHDYEVMRAVRDEREIRLRMDSAQYELEQMAEALHQ